MPDSRRLTYEPFTDATALITLEGEWDMSGCSEFVEAVSGAVAEARTRIVVDLALAGYLDSSMLGSLLSLQKMAEANGWPLVFVRPKTASVWRLFELTALAHRFTFVETRMDAVAHASLAKLPT